MHNLSVCVETDFAFRLRVLFELRLVLDFVACVHFWISVSVLLSYTTRVISKEECYSPLLWVHCENIQPLMYSMNCIDRFDR